ncbi:MAG: hypothetical protein KJ058_11925 [Thermoanaerobaculia bacterium]|nr:hypothetical protein [Thermoanaerobaculia bacterium]MCZ7650745.1 hypothetical protein [Thermoanaerobaculia bacterium]
MSRSRTLSLAVALLFAVALAPAAAAGEHRLGFGLHYWKTLDEIEGSLGDGIDDNGLSQLVSYQYLPGPFLKLEATVEYFPDGFGGATESAYSPQVFVIVGRGLYAGVGVGITRSSSFEDDWSDPFYGARVGYELPLLPRLDLDLNANYRFDSWSELEGYDSDVLTFGAVLRFTL